MRKYLFVSILLLILLGCNNIESPRIIKYRGWQGCIELSNDIVSVVVNPIYGGHVLSYRLHGRENVLWADTVINGWTLDEFTSSRRSPDAGRFDIGNERKTEQIHDRLWAGEYSIDTLGTSMVRLRSCNCAKMGLRLIKTYNLKPHSSSLSINIRLENITSDTLSYCVWTRTLLPAGGRYSCSMDVNSRQAFSEISLVTDSLVEHSHPRVVCVGEKFMAMPGGEREQKWGIRNLDGEYRYDINNLRYTKLNYVDTTKVYNNNLGIDFPNMIYFNQTFIEIEPNSPMFDIAPNGFAEYNEEWRLEKIDR